MLTTTWTDRIYYAHFPMRRIKAWMVGSVHLLQSSKAVSAPAEIQAGIVWLQTFHDTPLHLEGSYKSPREEKKQDLSQGIASESSRWTTDSCVLGRGRRDSRCCGPAPLRLFLPVTLSDFSLLCPSILTLTWSHSGIQWSPLASE